MFYTLGLIVAILGRIVTGATLLGAGIAKIQNGQSRFLQSILGYDLVPSVLAIFMARWLPYFETLVGVMLIAGLFSQVVSICAYGLFFVFSTAITLSLIRGMSNDYGCYRDVSSVKWRLVYRCIFLMGLLLCPVLWRSMVILLLLGMWLLIDGSINEHSRATITFD